MGVLSLPPTHPQPRIAFFLLRRVVKVVVWLLATCERRGSSLADTAFQEPKYVWFAMRCVVGDATCHLILGDMFEDYRRIRERGMVDADDWLRNELVETLLALIWRPAFVRHVLTSIRRLASFDFLRRTPRLLESKAGNSLSITNAFSNQPTVGIAFATLIVLSAAVLIFYGSRSVTQVEDYSDTPSSSELIAQQVQTPTDSTQTSETSVNTARNPAGTSRPNLKRDIHRVPKTLISEITLTSNITRSAGNNKVTTIPRYKTPSLSLELPLGSGRGLYDVTLRDAVGRVFFSSTAKSVDGKKVRIDPDLQKLLQQLPDNDYYFSLSERSNTNDSPINFRFVLSRK